MNKEIWSFLLIINTETFPQKYKTQSSTPVQYSSPVVQSSEWIHPTEKVEQYTVHGLYIRCMI